MAQRTFTLPQFQAYLNQLPKNLDKALPEINMEMAKSLQMKIKTRINPTSFFSSGHLKNSINVQKGKGKGQMMVTGPRYWNYVNLGIGPDVAIPLEFLEQHLANPKAKGKWVSDPTWVNTDEKPLKFDGNKGFVDKAIQALDKDSLRIIEMGLNKVFQK
jgi:hypothetical protein